MQIPDSVRDIFSKAPVVLLTTLNADGTPHVTAVNALIENDEVVIAHLGKYKKITNMQRNPTVALAVMTPDVPAKMQIQPTYLTIYGTARITEGGAGDLCRRMMELTGADAGLLPGAMLALPGYITHITPTRFSGVGPWADEENARALARFASLLPKDT